MLKGGEIGAFGGGEIGEIGRSLWRRLARAAEAVAVRPACGLASAPSGECARRQSHPVL